MIRSILFIVLAGIMSFSASAQIFYGAQAEKYVPGSHKVKIDKHTGNVEYFEFSSTVLKSANVNGTFLKQKLGLQQGYDLKVQKEQIDHDFDKHIKYQLYYNDIEIEGLGYTVHYKNGIPKSANGKIYNFSNVQISPVISESQALQIALSLFKANAYAWDKNQNTYPQPSLLFIPIDSTIRLSYKVDVHVLQPIQREYVYIDAITGKVLKRITRIHDVDQQGTAVTQYCDTVNITTNEDQGLYYLSETGRGNGIHTYDMNNGITYSNASDFSDDDNFWDNLSDKTAYDVHFSTEKTYDYYWSKFGRNSIDGQGFILNSYVHYDFNYANAFWNGECMTYGDGDGYSLNALTSTEIVAHEITHGLISFSANLEYAYESGALNESFSDIFGVAIDFYANPLTANYLMGEAVFTDGVSVIRNMQDPNSIGDPDTYQGNFWVTGSSDHGGVHTNSSVQNYWFYLLCEGGSGTNDNGDNYNVQAIGMVVAEEIAYRNLTVYLSQYSDFNDARFYSIQSAEDLFGACSNEVIQVTNAWHAVGVGEAYNNGVVAHFDADQTYFCNSPATVLNGVSVSTEANPSIDIDNPGDYDIKLIVTGQADCNGSDTIIQQDYITVSSNGGPIPALYTPTSVYGGNGGIYSFRINGTYQESGSADEGYVDNSCASNIIVKEGKGYDIQINTGISFTQAVGVWIDLNNDGQFSNTDERLLNETSSGFLSTEVIIPSCQNINTPLRLRVGTDRIEYASNLNGQSNSYYGQYEDYSVIIEDNTEAPQAFFSVQDTVVTTTELVNFKDESLNIPTQWNWTLTGADQPSSTIQNPTATYNSTGVYTVTLNASNSYGSSNFSRNIHVVNEFVMGATDVTNVLAGAIYDSGGEQGNYSNGENYTFLIQPDCADEITLTFSEFETESCCDYLSIYDGISSTDPLITTLRGSQTLPLSVTATSGSMYLVFNSDYSVTYSGFAANWITNELGGGNPVVADFEIPSGNIPLNFNYNFIDRSINTPQSWNWNFGDGNTSNEQNPLHLYQTPGDYSVQLIVNNCFGIDSIVQQITVDQGPEISLSSDTVFVNLFSGDIVEDFIPVANLSGGVLAYESSVTETYKQSIKEIDNHSIIGYRQKSAKGNFVEAMVPVYSNNDDDSSISKQLFTYKVTNDLSGVNVGVSNYTNVTNVLNTLTANGASYMLLSSNNTASALDTLDVIILDDNGFLLSTNSDAIRNWISNGGFAIIQGDEEITEYNNILSGSGITYVDYRLNSGYGEITNHEIVNAISQYYISASALSKLVLQAPAEALINDVNGLCYAAASTLGQGKVLSVADEAFNDMFDTGHTELFLNSMDWGARNRKSNWLQVEEGVRYIEVAESDSVVYYIDSNGLMEGVYTGNIQVATNDSDNLIVDIPLKLNVTGVPNIESIQSSIMYPKVFVNHTDSALLTLRNTGTANLVIDSIRTSDSELSLSFIPQVLEPGQSVQMYVCFTPSVAQVYNANVFVYSNDSDMPVLSIPTQGIAVLPPIFGVSNSTIQANLFTNEISEVNLNITNSGGSALAIDSITVINFNATNNLLTDTLQVDMANHSISTPRYSFYEFNSLLISQGAEISTTSLDTVNTSDVVCITYDNNYNLNANHIEFLDRWIQQGGSLYVEANSISSSSNIYELLTRMGVSISSGYYYPNQIQSTDHIVMERILGSNVFPNSSKEINAENGTPLIIDGSNNVFATTVNYGYGRVIVTGFSCLNYLNNADRKLFVLNSMRWLANKNSWLWVSNYPQDSVQVGESTDLKITFDAANRLAGTYDAIIHVATNDPITPRADIQAVLNVTGIPVQSFERDTVVFNSQFIGYSKTDSVLVYNSGTADLDVSNVYTTNSDYTIELNSFTLTPRQSKWLKVNYSPSSEGMDNAFLIFENNTVRQSDTLLLEGNGIIAPSMTLTPTEINILLSPGEQELRRVYLGNINGGSDLSYSISINYDSASDGDQELQVLLDSLNNQYSSITSLIPNCFYFRDGVTGTYISDGGSDMYDTGNFLNTNNSNSIPYSDNQVMLSTSFGQGGKYFTRKYDGLFVLAADIYNLDNFSISGGLGADSYGSVDGTVLTAQVNGNTYKGYVKRVYGTGDPSINHLIITKDNDNTYHQFSSNTDSDSHTLYGLSQCQRIYYLLYAGTSGSYISDSTTLSIMSQFLSVVEGTNSGWLQPNNYQGVVSAGQTNAIELLINANDLQENTYRAVVNIETNDPQNNMDSVVVNLEVSYNQPPRVENPIGNKVIYMSYNGQIDLDSVFVDPDGDQLHYQLSSSNNSVVFPALNNGSQLQLAPISTGFATITIQASDQLNVSVSHTFDVLVRANSSPYVTSSIEDVLMDVSEITRVINLSSHFADPDGDQITYSFITTNDEVARLENGGDLLLISALSDGATIVTVIANDAKGGSATTSFMTYVSGVSTDISQVESSGDICVYPNPVDDILFIKSRNGKPISFVSLADLNGRNIILDSSISNNEVKLDLSNIATGLYFIKIKYQDTVINYKIIKR
jgi:Zn-dependent metalloprotease